jgi:hypothetical protein
MFEHCTRKKYKEILFTFRTAGLYSETRFSRVNQEEQYRHIEET